MKLSGGLDNLLRTVECFYDAFLTSVVSSLRSNYLTSWPVAFTNWPVERWIWNFMATNGGNALAQILLRASFLLTWRYWIPDYWIGSIPASVRSQEHFIFPNITNKHSEIWNIICMELRLQKGRTGSIFTDFRHKKDGMRKIDGLTVKVDQPNWNHI